MSLFTRLLPRRASASRGESSAPLPAGDRAQSTSGQRGWENRAAQRSPRASTAQLLHYPAGRHQHPIDVQVTDYSATGIGVTHHEGLLIGKTFVVREPHVTAKNTCLFTVVRSEARPDGTFSIGLHVGNSLSNEHDPLLEIPPAPGVSRGNKILFLAFALLGIVMILAATLFKPSGG